MFINNWLVTILSMLYVTQASIFEPPLAFGSASLPLVPAPLPVASSPLPLAPASLPFVAPSLHTTPLTPTFHPLPPALPPPIIKTPLPAVFYPLLKPHFGDRFQTTPIVKTSAFGFAYPTPVIKPLIAIAIPAPIVKTHYIKIVIPSELAHAHVIKTIPTYASGFPYYNNHQTHTHLIP